MKNEKISLKATNLMKISDQSSVTTKHILDPAKILGSGSATLQIAKSISRAPRLASWYLYQMVTQNMLRTCERKQNFSEILSSNLRLLPKYTNALNRSDYRSHSAREHLFLSYHLIQVPWISIVYPREPRLCTNKGSQLFYFLTIYKIVKKISKFAFRVVKSSTAI